MAFIKANQLDPSIFVGRKSQLNTMKYIFICCVVATVVTSGINIYTLSTRRAKWTCADQGHRFTPRYNTLPVEADALKAAKLFPYNDERRLAITQAAKRVYLCDICTYCGASLPRDSK